MLLLLIGKRMVEIFSKIDPGGAVDLTDNDPVGTVDNKRSVLGHQGQVAQENLVFFDESGVSVH